MEADEKLMRFAIKAALDKIDELEKRLRTVRNENVDGATAPNV